MPWVCSKRPGCGAAHRQSSQVRGRGCNRGGRHSCTGLGCGLHRSTRVWFRLCPPRPGHPSGSAGRGAANMHRRRRSRSICSPCMEGGHEQHHRDPAPWALAPPVPTHPHADSIGVVKSRPPGPWSIKAVDSHGDLSIWQCEGQLGVLGDDLRRTLMRLCHAHTWVWGVSWCTRGREGVHVLPTRCQRHGRETSCVLPQLSFLCALAGWSQQGEEDAGMGASQPQAGLCGNELLSGGSCGYRSAFQ